MKAGKTIYTNKDTKQIKFNSISEAADWVINNKYSKGNKHSVISKISECINPNAKRKRAFGFEWFCDDYVAETKNKSQINQYDLAGKYIATHSSAIEAARSLGEDALLACHIREVCKNQRKTAKGFIWKYAV